ncbi:protein-L-isoaspartate O-methyltransferase [Neoconidiobolus thromboides FSU 785]|nr:protein-L-isoaspartate O-methyltransferase [Neoconidiobolus thromboides FSU 785]
MKRVDRMYFCKKNPYEDSPQVIGFNATISAPHMHAYALESLKDYLNIGSRVLDIGSGSGYLTACMRDMVGSEGKVIGIEHIPELAEMSRQNLNNWNKEHNVEIIQGDGRVGLPDKGPYDCIHVGAASKDLPQSLIEQLKAPGKMFIPVGQNYQSIFEIIKDKNGNITQNEIMAVRYVPLTSAKEQLNGD